MGKLVYKDGERIKAYRGKLVKEDDFFVWFLTEEKQENLRVSKKYIVSLESGDRDGRRKK